MMLRKTIRIHRRDSAFVYAILESLEGMTSYSTLETGGPDHRELELYVAPGFADDIEEVLNGMRKKIPILEYSPTDERRKPNAV